MIGTSGDVIGRYERGVIIPSVEVVSKIAQTLDVSLDYLIGKTKIEMDKQALKRVEDISKLPVDKKITSFNLSICAYAILKQKRLMLRKITNRL